MAKKRTLHPAVPAFSTDFLGKLAHALSARAKAIRYGSRSFVCEREVDEDGDEMMVITLSESTLDKKNAVMNFSFWCDGTAYFGVHVRKAGKNQSWEYSCKANADLLRIDPTEIVQRFVKTVAEAVYGHFKSDAQNMMREIWRGTELDFRS